MRMAPLLPTWYWRTSCPDSHTALPLAEIDVKIARWLADANRSPRRPPQPTVAPSGWNDCQVFCWSLCENRLAGRGCPALAYCALVVGRVSGPTLGTMARRRSVSNIVRSAPR